LLGKEEFQEALRVDMAKSPSSKRKKSSASTSTSSKKVRLQVLNNDPSDNPIVVSFPRGLPEALQPNSDNSSAVPPRFVWQKLNEKSKTGRKVVGHDKHCIYSGSSKGIGFDERRTKLCIGVYDKKNGVMRIQEAASRGTVYSLEQAVPSYLNENPQDTFQVGKNLVEYSNAVFADFGTSKKRKVLKSQAANRVELENVLGAGSGSAMVEKIATGQHMSESNKKAIELRKSLGDDAKSSVEQVSMTFFATILFLVRNKDLRVCLCSFVIFQAHEEHRKSFLPEYDMKAKKPGSVYNPKSIAGENAWTRLSREVEACMRKDDVVQALISGPNEQDILPCVAEVLKQIPPNAVGAKPRFITALMLNWIIVFYKNNHHRKIIRSPDTTKSRWFGMPMEVAQRCLSLFATEASDEKGVAFAMSKANKDKCLVHALLLYMMAQGDKMKIPSLKPIASDMKLTVNDCAQKLRLAGCTTAKSGDNMTAELKLPLTFPKAKRVAGGSSRR
jgi:hypothetical protein